MFRRKKIPPPLDTGLPPKPETQHAICLPYDIAEYPRQLLLWLSRNEAVPEQIRNVIQQLVIGYSQELLAFLWINYGYSTVLEADAISKRVAEAFYSAVDQEYKEYEADLLSRLEEDFRADEQ